VSLRLALREIRNHPRFAAFFTLNLALGFAGFAALDAFERSVSGELRQRSKAYLAADVAVSAGRPLADEEVRHLDSLAGADARISRAAQLFSMAAGEGRSRLVEIHAIDSDFPLYGAVVLEDTGPAGPEQKSALRDAAGAWVDPPLLTQLDVDLGDELRIGSATFRIQGAVARDGSRGSSGFSIAPRVYIALAQLERTGLVATGSRVQYRRTYRLPPGADSDGLARSMRLGVADPAIAVRSHREATRDLARAYASVSDHLGLVALIAIFLAGLGAAHLFRSFLSRRVRELAVLLCLGTTRGTAQLVFFVQVGLLSLAASLCACGIAALLLPALTRLAGGFVPPDFQPRVGWQAVGLVLLLSATASASACLPLVARLRSLKPAELFAEHAQPALGRWAVARATRCCSCRHSPCSGWWRSGAPEASRSAARSSVSSRSPSRYCCCSPWWACAAWARSRCVDRSPPAWRFASSLEAARAPCRASSPSHSAPCSRASRHRCAPPWRASSRRPRRRDCRACSSSTSSPSRWRRSSVT
jgi:putative ABC transport system permease protein